MSTPATGQASGSSTRDDRRWHYRRSLASRVVLLTTMAVGLAVALVALGAYVTVRMSLESSLDNSLRDRAHQAAAEPPILAQLTTADIPDWAIGAADVRIYLRHVSRHPHHHRQHESADFRSTGPRRLSPR